MIIMTLSLSNNGVFLQNSLHRDFIKRFSLQYFRRKSISNVFFFFCRTFNGYFCKNNVFALNLNWGISL